MKILHAMKAGTWSLVLEPQNKLFVLVIAFFLLYSTYIAYTCVFTFISTCYLLLASSLLVDFSLSHSRKQLRTITHGLEDIEEKL